MPTCAGSHAAWPSRPRRRKPRPPLSRGRRRPPVRQYSDAVDETYVLRQSPQPGDRTQKGNFVTIYSSLGPKKTKVPRIVGEPLASALSALRDANLTWRVVEVNSDQDEGTVV